MCNKTRRGREIVQEIGSDEIPAHFVLLCSLYLTWRTGRVARETTLDLDLSKICSPHAVTNLQTQSENLDKVENGSSADEELSKLTQGFP